MDPFEEWWFGMEGFTLRCERAVEELGLTDAAIPRLRQWLEAAFEVGLEAASVSEEPAK